jgi:hypothetical protein
MKIHVVRVLACLSLALVAAQAAAIPTLRKVQPTFTHAGGNKINAGLVVEAETGLAVLGVGGGYTIQCSTSSLTLAAQDHRTSYGFFGPRLLVNVPSVLPTVYTIPQWSSVPIGNCAECHMQFNGEARDETDTSMTIGAQGVGVSFTLIPDGQVSAGNTLQLQVCRAGRPQCCTPGCQIP